MTFGLLLWLDVPVKQFRTGWFLESVVSAALIVASYIATAELAKHIFYRLVRV